jgi:hypothetical protein
VQYSRYLSELQSRNRHIKVSAVQQHAIIILTYHETVLLETWGHYSRKSSILFKNEEPLCDRSMH